jgi:tetratricopeptide (TPR) repeat protein
VEEALEFSERLLRVAPLDASFRDDRVRSFVFARQYERAFEEAERARELEPDFEDLSIADAYVLLGSLEEAHLVYLAIETKCGASYTWSRDARERGWAKGGWEGSLRAWLDAATKREGVAPVIVAFQYIMLGEPDEAFAWLERAYRERDPMMLLLDSYPVFDPLRSDPRFDDLLRRIGFPES